MLHSCVRICGSYNIIKLEKKRKQRNKIKPGKRAKKIQIISQNRSWTPDQNAKITIKQRQASNVYNKTMDSDNTQKPGIYTRMQDLWMFRVW